MRGKLSNLRKYSAIFAAWFCSCGRIVLSFAGYYCSSHSVIPLAKLNVKNLDEKYFLHTIEESGKEVFANFKDQMEDGLDERSRTNFNTQFYRGFDQKSAAIRKKSGTLKQFPNNNEIKRLSECFTLFFEKLNEQSLNVLLLDKCECRSHYDTIIFLGQHKIAKFCAPSNILVWALMVHKINLTKLQNYFNSVRRCNTTMTFKIFLIADMRRTNRRSICTRWLQMCSRIMCSRILSLSMR